LSAEQTSPGARRQALASFLERCILSRRTSVSLLREGALPDGGPTPHGPAAGLAPRASPRSDQEGRRAEHLMAELSYPALEHAGTALQRTLEARLHEGFMVSHLRIFGRSIHSSTQPPPGADEREREEEREQRSVPGSVFQKDGPASAAAAAEGPASHYAEVELSFPFADGAEVCRPASGPARPPLDQRARLPRFPPPLAPVLTGHVSSIPPY